ncbi:MAG TPA: N-acetylmuramoyl-L-alanine amidase [Pseudogracilibacillus sp.]|nr:N-acetylmuramoyl-L-alanine amidase [Pseudogracilibacillus sp.]
MRIKITSFTIILFAILFLLSPNSTLANDDIKYVSNNDINVRASADPNGEVIGKLKYGEKIEVIDEQYGWTKFSYKGEDAWVASHLLVDTKPFDQAQISKSNKDKSLIKHDKFVSKIVDPLSIEVNKDIDDFNKMVYQKRLFYWLFNRSPSSNNNHALHNYTIVLDPGHGGHDPGSTALNGNEEKDLTLSIAKAIASYLEERGVQVILTRETDMFVPLNKRIEFAEAYEADFFISIHFDAFTSENSSGVTSHYFEDKQAKQLASYIQHGLKVSTGLNSRGLFESNYEVLRENETRAILLELGFITNKKDLKAIESDTYHEQVAKAISRALNSYFITEKKKDS